MREFFGLDDDWARPLPANWLRLDAVIAVGTFLGGIFALEVLRAMGGMHEGWPRWGLYGATALGSVALVWRRRFPVAVMLILALHMFVFGVTQSVIMANMAMQSAYFFGIFSAMAWGRDRRMAVLATGGVVLFMFGWVAVQLSVGAMRDDFLVSTYGDRRGMQDGALFGPVTAMVLQTTMINILFFFTAVATGASSWRGARQQARAESQARTIEAQADRLTEQAVVDERLRIARELHDVVAHHVAAIGIQAAASRKLMTKDAELAAQSLTNVETSSREAVTQMRSLLGTLRAGEAQGLDDASGRAGSGAGSPETRRPEPSLGELPALIDDVRATGLDVDFTDLTGPGLRGGAELPGSLGHSIYRTVQEALANVRRHSTATSASVALRLGGEGQARYIEAEILDDGRARQGTSGSGLGLMGMRERVTAHRGKAEIGPRVTGGYRVRVRFPLDDAGQRPSCADGRALEASRDAGRKGTE